MSPCGSSMIGLDTHKEGMQICHLLDRGIPEVYKGLTTKYDFSSGLAGSIVDCGADFLFNLGLTPTVHSQLSQPGLSKQKQSSNCVLYHLPQRDKYSIWRGHIHRVA